jgi:hypothetical protein
VDGSVTPTFKSDVDIVTLDVAVIGPNGQFIPQIPPGNFRVLEDNVPQQVRKVDMAQAPLTVALLVEFSNRYQSYGSWTWYGDAANGVDVCRLAQAGGLLRGDHLRDEAGDPDRLHRPTSGRFRRRCSS